jgi:endonuclease YncB( thermonuclease family)
MTLCRSFALAALAAIFATAAAAASWTVTDGDTIRRGDERVRIFGLDAPEADQRCERAGACYLCGRTATAALAELLDGEPVTILPTGDVSYGRIVARVMAGRVDVTEAMLRQGHAIAYRRFLQPGPVRDAYLAAEAEAQAVGRGIWAGRFDRPGDWRRDRGSVCR